MEGGQKIAVSPAVQGALCLQQSDNTRLGNKASSYWQQSVLFTTIPYRASQVCMRWYCNIKQYSQTENSP